MEDEEKQEEERKKIADGEGTLDLPGSSIFRGRPFVEAEADLFSSPLVYSKREKKGGHDMEAVYKRCTCPRRSRGEAGCLYARGRSEGVVGGVGKNGESH